MKNELSKGRINLKNIKIFAGSENFQVGQIKRLHALIYS